MSFVDSLWEFVLEDYEDEESTRRERFGRNRGKKTDTKLSTGNRGLLANLSSSKNSKRGNQIEYRDDKEDGFWDVISGAPPAATIIKRSNSYSGRTKSSKGRGLMSKTSPPKTSRSASLTRSQSSLSEGDTNSNEKKKNMFKKRFSWNQNSKSQEDASTKEYSIKDLDVKQTTSSNDREDAKTPSDSDNYDVLFDPIDLLFHIADSIDPLEIDPSEASISDVDSHDGTDTVDDDDANSHIADLYAEESLLNMGFPDDEVMPSKSMNRSSKTSRNKKSSGKSESLLDQELPKPTTFDPNRYPYHSKQPRKEENGHTTEIRLRVNPVGNTLSEEVYETNANSHEKREQFVQKSSTLDEEICPSYRSSFDSDALKSSQMFERVSNRSSVTAKEKRTTVRVPTNAHITEGAKSNKTTNGLKKAVCGLKKVGRNDLIHSSRRSDAAEVFPSSRVVINGETHLVTGPECDPINGMMSTAMKGSKGPQSVFAYDYDSNMNMDVNYTKQSHNPRTDISVRKLGAPPPLSSDSENIVVKVEASIVSETDCIIRQGLWWGDSKPSFPNTPGINVVGKVYCTKQTTGKVYGLKLTQTVLSLVKWGGNARFISIHPKQLVSVPEGLDPVEVACLPECYLSAFQVLHMGQTGNRRYREGSMKGKSILILGCMTNNMGKAIIELALQAGVANIYATAKKKHWKTLISYGVMPLSTDPMAYIQRIAGTMDLVLAPNGNLREDVSPVHFRALVPKYGQLIISGHRIVGNDIPIEDWKRARQAPTLSCGKSRALQKILRNSLSYDVYHEWEKNLDMCKHDLSHLLKLLECKSIKPEVLDRIPLIKVAKAHELLETKRLPGFLVCEPWMKSKKRALYL